MKIILVVLLGFTLFCTLWGTAPAGESTGLKITILYDNYVYTPGTKSDWGFACLIEGTEKTILFDTGTKSSILLHNVKTLGVDLNKVEMIVISHNHGDHTGGLYTVLTQYKRVPVYMPASTGDEIVKKMEDDGVRVYREAKPVKLCEKVFLTGEMGDSIKEQSLVIDSPGGLIVLTGCAHPGIVKITERSATAAHDVAKRYSSQEKSSQENKISVNNNTERAKKMYPGRKIRLVLGGFHLMRKSDKQLAEIIERFREMGVLKVGATHCTGDHAIEVIKKAYGKDFIRLGTGKKLLLSDI